MPKDPETNDSKTDPWADGEADSFDDGDSWSETDEPGSSKWVSRRQRDPERSEERRLSERRRHPRHRRPERDRQGDE